MHLEVVPWLMKTDETEMMKPMKIKESMLKFLKMCMCSNSYS